MDIETYSPNELPNVALRLCARMRDLRQKRHPTTDDIDEMDRIYESLRQIQPKLRIYRIRVGKVTRQIRVISSPDG